MTDEIENIDSQNDDVEVETTEEETTTEDSKDELSDREKQFLARAKKAESKLKEVKTSIEEPKPELKETNTEQAGLTREEAIFYSKGGNEENLALAKKIAEVEGIGILAAMEDDLYISKITAQEEEAKVKANQLGVSGGSPVAGGHKEKPISKMTREEHVEHAKKKIEGLMG